MSKLASGVEGTDRASLEALVAQGDTSVPNIEMSDLNDGDILARTRENVDANGLFQFVYIPEDGSPNVTSDWIDQEHKKKVTRGWVDGVKSAIIGRAQSKLQEAKDAQLEERAKRIRAEQLADDEPVGGEYSAPPEEAYPVRVAPRPQVQVVRNTKAASADPGDYVNDQLELARERLRGAETAQQDIVREVLLARRDYDKWKALSAALGGIGDDGVRATDEAVSPAFADPSSGGDWSSIVRRPERSDRGNAGRGIASYRAPGPKGDDGAGKKARG